MLFKIKRKAIKTRKAGKRSTSGNIDNNTFVKKDY